MTPAALERPPWLRSHVEVLEFLYVAFLCFIYANCVVSVVLAVYADARRAHAAAAARLRSEHEAAVTAVRDAATAHAHGGPLRLLDDQTANLRV